MSIGDGAGLGHLSVGIKDFGVSVAFGVIVSLRAKRGNPRLNEIASLHYVSLAMTG